jgi:hypothetical protein
LGTELTRHRLVDARELEKANGFLLDYLRESDFRRACLPRILCWDLAAMREDRLINFLMEEHDLAHLSLSQFETNPDTLPDVEMAALWTTWTLPIDRFEGFTFLATCYYLSQPVRHFWEDFIEGRVVWYTVTLEDMQQALEQRSQALESAA